MRMRFSRLMAVFVVTLGTMVFVGAESATPAFVPDQPWLDTDGVAINAHGGGVLEHRGRWYWFGEHKIEGRAGNQSHVGVRCYSSNDLVNWTNEGVALAVVEEAGHDLEKGCIIERPKVIHVPATGKFVMWFHLELKGQGYASARSGVAVADHPAGPYRFIESVRPNAGVYARNLSQSERAQVDAWREAGVTDPRERLEALQVYARDLDGGQMARDMTLFVDADDAIYHVFASEENRTLHVSRLSEDGLRHMGEYWRIMPEGRNEAPALWRHDGRYYLLTSGLTGWEPNPARSFVADSLAGPWTYLGNPCRGENPHNRLGPEKTFGGQSTFVLPITTERGPRFIAMFDVWRPKNAIDGGYVWLPISWEAGRFNIRWRDRWTLADLP